MTAWTLFQYDLVQQQHGAPCPSGAQIVQRLGGPVRVGLVPTLPRPRNPTNFNTPVRVGTSSDL